MAGLALGIEVQPGPSDLIEKGEARRLTLYANAYESGYLYPRSGPPLNRWQQVWEVTPALVVR